MIVSTSTDAPKCKKSTLIPMIKSKRHPSQLRDLNRMVSTDRSVDETSQPDKQESFVSAPIGHRRSARLTKSGTTSGATSTVTAPVQNNDNSGAADNSGSASDSDSNPFVQPVKCMYYLIFHKYAKLFLYQ